MVTSSIQDRTAEFRSVLAQARKRQASAKTGAPRQTLLNPEQQAATNGKRSARSEFARRAAEIGRGITGTMEKLERLAQRKNANGMGARWHGGADGQQWPGRKPCSTTDRSRSPN